MLNHEFQTRIHAWHTLLARSPGHQFALYINDSLEFASALFGGWLAGKTFYLPGNILPAACKALSGQVDGYLGDFPRDCLPMMPAASDTDAFTQGAISNNPNYPISDFEGLIIYTSGTTGDAQAIPKRLSQMAAEIVTLENLFGDKIGPVETEIVATVSHEHIYGLLFKLLWPLTTGRVIHVRSAVFIEELLPLLTTRDCVLISTPAHLKRLPEISNTALTTPHLRALFSSGAPLSQDAARATERVLGKAPIEIYGSSETGGIAWRQRNVQPYQPIDESWQPMPGVAWRIAAVGDALEIRSQHLPDNHWFRMADRAIPAQNDRFLLAGRLDRLVKLEGKRISLDAIERCLAASPLVAQARVLMRGDGDQRQCIAAFIVPTGDTLATAGKRAFNQQLRHLLMDTVEPVALPRLWRYLEAFPVNPQGKTTRTELMALLEKGPSVRPRMPPHRLMEQSEQRALFELKIPPDLFYFEGHFPAAPILPGVVQIDWAITYGRQSFDLPPFFRGMHLLKFQNVISPGMTVTLELLHDSAKSLLAFRLYSPLGQHASGRILFSTEASGHEKTP